MLSSFTNIHFNCTLILQTTMIYPATAKHIEKYKKQDVSVVEETYDDYKNITLPFLEGENKFSVQVLKS